MSEPRKVFAGNVVIDNTTSQITIDGAQLPWWLALPGPTVESGDVPGIQLLTLPVWVEGTITIINEDQSVSTYDPVFGNVRAWATNYVREQFAAAYPDLVLP